MTAWLVVGLGNPGSRYAGTRHNIGVQVVERLAERLGTRLRKVRFLPIDAGEATIDGKRLLLARPQTFVNVSGPPVAGDAADPFFGPFAPGGGGGVALLVEGAADGVLTLGGRGLTAAQDRH